MHRLTNENKQEAKWRVINLFSFPNLKRKDARVEFIQEKFYFLSQCDVRKLKIASEYTQQRLDCCSFSNLRKKIFPIIKNFSSLERW